MGLARRSTGRPTFLFYSQRLAFSRMQWLSRDRLDRTGALQHIRGTTYSYLVARANRTTIESESFSGESLRSSRCKLKGHLLSNGTSAAPLDVDRGWQRGGRLLRLAFTDPSATARCWAALPCLLLRDGLPLPSSRCRCRDRRS